MNDAMRPAGRFLAGLALCALAVLAFWDVPRSGPTASDDLTYERAVLEGRIGAFSAELAAGSGRFHHYLHVGLTSLAYRMDSPPLRRAVALAGFLGVIIALAALAARLSRRPELGLLVATLALGLYQDNWHHNILTAYPFVFDSGMLCLLTAAYALVRRAETGRTGWLVVANLALFLSFAHFEAFVAYVPVLAGLVWLTTPGGSRQRLRALVPAFAVLPVYAAVYLGYRLTHPSQYAGNALDLTSPAAILKTAWAYSRPALPLGGFAFNLEYVNRFPQFSKAYVLSFGQYLSELAANLSLLAPAWVALALLAGGLTAYCLDRAARSRLPWLAWLLCAFAVVCPNALIALSPKYQEPAASGLAWYVTTTFSFYAVAVLLALGGLALAGRLPAKPRRMLAVGLGLAVGLTALVNASVNASVRDSKIAAGARWRVAALACQSRLIAGLPEGARLIAPDLFAAVNTELVGPDYWPAYFRAHAGRGLTVASGLEQADPEKAPVYVLRRLSGLLDRDTALVLARVTGLGPAPADPYAAAPDAPTLLAGQAVVAMDAANRFYDLVFRDASGRRRRPVFAHRHHGRPAFAGLHGQASGPRPDHGRGRPGVPAFRSGFFRPRTVRHRRRSLGRRHGRTDPGQRHPGRGPGDAYGHGGGLRAGHGGHCRRAAAGRRNHRLFRPGHAPIPAAGPAAGPPRPDPSQPAADRRGKTLRLHRRPPRPASARALTPLLLE